MENLLPPRDPDGQLPSYGWPGGYPLYYLDRHGCTFCPGCATAELDQDEPDPATVPLSGHVNYDDDRLHCEQCGRRIESAYAEDEDAGEREEDV